LAFGMSGTATDDLETRRKRLRFRAWHRGTRELDLLLGPFADADAANFDAAEIATFEALLEVPDPEIYAWIVGNTPAPASHDTPLFRRLRAFHLQGRGRTER
jgi:antitoxin CptB